MLALQRPEGMGSSQPPEADRPFGYSFDPAAAQQEFLSFMNPPEPAPGQPLLSDNDNKLLGNFFESMEENFALEGLNFSEDWLSLPPQFMGHTTSFGQQPPPTPLDSSSMPPHAAHMSDLHAPSASLMLPPPPPPQPRTAPEHHASADVLAAATLLQNGAMSRPTSNHSHSSYSRRSTQPSLGPPMGHLRHQPLTEFRQEGRRISQAQGMEEHDNTFTDMMFGSAPSRPAAPRGPPIEVQWGSDVSFGRQQPFVPQSAKDTSEAMINQSLSYMECLEVSNSAANTRPSSPIHNGDASPPQLRTWTPVIKQEDDADGRPSKRRKSKAKDENEDDEVLPGASATSSKAPTRKSKSKSDGSGLDSPAPRESAARRRKSAAANAAKGQRENLSESQKRENHIKSEQKRRTVIKEGFDDLCDLVPGLKGGGFSKSAMLSMAGEWLEELLQGNKALQTQLDTLEGR